jgi:hypothetical protein
LPSKVVFRYIIQRKNDQLIADIKKQIQN